MSQVKISIIVPTFNEERNIANFLNQLSNVFEKHEIIITDGGSSDKTPEICMTYPVTFISGPLGRGKQLNYGARQATGDILFFVHCDSTIESRVFEDIKKAVHRGYKWGCCTIDFTENTLFFKAVALGSRFRASVLSSCYGDQGIFCERDLFFSAGGFPDWPLFEDVSISRQLRYYSKAKVVEGKIITSTRRFRHGGLFKTLLKMQLLKILFTLGISPESLAKIYRSTS